MKRLCSWLLAALLPEGDASPLLGDLDEEMCALAARQGSAAAGRWYVRQCAGSVAPLLLANLRRLSARQWQQSLGAVLVFVLAPIQSTELLRGFVLGQIPLKDDAVRSPHFLAAMLALAMICGAAASLAARRVPSWIVACLAWLSLSAGGWPLALWLASLPCLLAGARAGPALHRNKRGIP